MNDKWGYVWPLDENGNRVSVSDFTDLDMVRYHVYQARVECTINDSRNIGEEIIYLTNWYFYFNLLMKAGRFDPDSLAYFSLEIGRLYKERVGWH